MAGIPFARLMDKFIIALELSGATVLEVGERRKPSRIRVITAEGSLDCLIFLWTITPGGGGLGVRPANERRIQVTSAREFPLVPGLRTVVGGWSEPFGAYAFWDPRRHSKFSLRSPSFQIGANALEEGSANGIATYVRDAKEGREVVVAISPSSLLWYLLRGHEIHNADEDAQGVQELVTATPENERHFMDTSESEPQAARRYELVEVMRTYRESAFRPAVMQAYSYRCAVCRCALKLVDAAHIVPVFHPKSTDQITNGIALCRQHHGAYDNGLIGIRSDYRIIVNPETVRRLEKANLKSGLEAFKASLPPEISLPGAIEVRPDPGNLRIGLEARLWPRSLIA
jgi:putative restriction endonuclease